MSICVVWVVTPCGLVGRYQCFVIPKLQVVRFSETLVSTRKPTQRYNPEDQHRHSVCELSCCILPLPSSSPPYPVSAPTSPFPSPTTPVTPNPPLSLQVIFLFFVLCVACGSWRIPRFCQKRRKLFFYLFVVYLTTLSMASII
jgi:hypothetical protein